MGRSAAVLAATLPLLAGCSGAGSVTTSQPATAEIVEKDFRISAPETLSPGDLDLLVRNRGPVSHEFIVVRGTVRDLPMRKDGVTVDEDAIEDDTVGALEPQSAGVHDLRVSLQPGRYVFLCNMAGHYRGGMHTELVVR